jgi:hypothetical protein
MTKEERVAADRENRLEITKNRLMAETRGEKVTLGSGIKKDFTHAK